MLLEKLDRLNRNRKIEYLVEGTYAVVFLLPNGRILKVLDDHGQVDYLREFANTGRAFPIIHCWKEIEGKHVLVMEKLTPLLYSDTTRKLMYSMNKDFCLGKASDYSVFGQSETFTKEMQRLIDATKRLDMYEDIHANNIMIRNSTREIVFLDPWA